MSDGIDPPAKIKFCGDADEVAVFTALFAVLGDASKPLGKLGELASLGRLVKN